MIKKCIEKLPLKTSHCIYQRVDGGWSPVYRKDWGKEGNAAPELCLFSLDHIA